MKHHILVRWASVAALAALTAATLTACNGAASSSSSSGSVTLTALDYYTDDPTHTHIGDQLDKCAASLGVKVVHQSVPGNTLIQKVLQYASSKSLPDMLLLDNPDVQQIAATGALAPLDDFGINADGYAEGPKAASTYKGKLYGLQPVSDTLVLFYNKDILSKAGVEPPTTWAELKSTALKLTDGKQYGIAFDATADYEGAWQFLAPMWTNGGDETDLTSPQVAEALQLWKDLVDDGSASKSVLNWGQTAVGDEFTAGRAAMMVNGPWEIPQIDKNKINYGVVAFPVNKAGQKSVAPLGGEAWTVPMTGDKNKMAKSAAVVTCVNSDADQKQRSQLDGELPAKISTAKEYKSENPSMGGFVDAVITARARTGKLGAKWPDAAKVIYTAVQLVLTDQATPADAMAKAKAGG